ncbi:KANK1 [Bugula neritina]|uniref:KANK1 n=1 Tax=Bugula neritina TaxID=10212 RepID=A0A7J7J988_BUGNE|nr:KANK1 [Bugula neritina]
MVSTRSGLLLRGLYHLTQVIVTPERNGSNTYSTLSPSYHSVDRKQYRKEGKLQELSSPNSYSPHSSLENSDGYAAHSRNLFTKTTRTITSSNILPNTGENESLTISPEAIRQIKQHAEDSNKLIVDLQEQLKLIPQMQERIRRLKEDKKNLAYQLQNKSGVSSMRSIGVGDFDVDDDHVRVERIKQTVTQEVAKPPMRSVGVGVYDINTELFTQADVIHTVAEHVQRIREREIQSWIQEAEATHEARKASTRSFGVGDKNVWDEENRLIKERELKTLLIEQSKPSQRNVGMQVKPSMRDVCIEYSHQEPEPLTRSCGVNVDISDIMQEMASHNAENSGNLYQQQNSWTLQKHVIQRKFMDAMTTGRQEDLVNFITGLLKKSVRSVGVTAKPVTAEKGTSKLSSTCEKGVSNDSVDVVVKPFVQTRDAFTLSKPSTRTQPTWTDLILTCDAGTNTHKYQTDKSVNTSAPPQVLNEKTTTKSLQTYNTPLRDINRTITETTVTERRTTKTAPEVERKYHTHIDRMMTPPSRPVELDIALPKQLTSSERNQVSEQMLRESRQLEGQHRTEVHMLLPRSAEPLTPLRVKVLPGDNKIAGTTYTLLAQSNSLDQSHGSESIRLSPVRAKSLTRECRRTARRLLESKRGGYIRSRSLSGDRHSASTGSTPALLSPSVSTTKTVVSEDTPHSTMKETTELTESGDTVKSERVIERTFSKSGGTSTTRSSAIGNSDYNSGSLADFDYFGKSYSGAQPKGHADRMERYMGSMRYTSTKPDVDEVRNITELHGNPLKSRYTIEEMSSGMESGPHSTIISESSSKPKSLLKDKDSPRNRKVSGVKFADEVLEQVNLSRSSTKPVKSCRSFWQLDL